MKRTVLRIIFASLIFNMGGYLEKRKSLYMVSRYLKGGFHKTANWVFLFFTKRAAINKRKKNPFKQLLRTKLLNILRNNSLSEIATP